MKRYGSIYGLVVLIVVLIVGCLYLEKIYAEEDIEKYTNLNYKKLFIIKLLQEDNAIKKEYDLQTKKVISIKEFDPNKIKYGGPPIYFSQEISLILFGWAELPNGAMAGSIIDPPKDLSINLVGGDKFAFGDIMFTAGSVFGVCVGEKINIPNLERQIEIFRLYTVTAKGVILVPFAFVTKRNNISNIIYFGTDIHNNVIDWGIEVNGKIISLSLNIPLGFTQRFRTVSGQDRSLHDRGGSLSIYQATTAPNSDCKVMKIEKGTVGIEVK